MTAVLIIRIVAAPVVAVVVVAGRLVPFLSAMAARHRLEREGGIRREGRLVARHGGRMLPERSLRREIITTGSWSGCGGEWSGVVYSRW